jgi:molybdopterin-guanine dinucleotide biosynthesis protein A
MNGKAPEVGDGTRPPLSAVILAGGQSRRMGRDKAWIECDGRPLIVLALEKVREIGVTEVFVSGRPGGDYSALGCPVLLDLEPDLGPLAGLERGLHACTSPLLLVLAVDLPRITSRLLRALADEADRTTGVVPEQGDQLEPLCAIYPKHCHGLAFERIQRGSRAVREFAAECLREKAVRLWKVPVSEASCFANCNFPEDLRITRKN